MALYFLLKISKGQNILLYGQSVEKLMKNKINKIKQRQNQDYLSNIWSKNCPVKWYS